MPADAPRDNRCGVAQVHDLHLWTLTSGMNVATAHLVAVPGADHQKVLGGAQDVLSERYAIVHATLPAETRRLRQLPRPDLVKAA